MPLVTLGRSAFTKILENRVALLKGRATMRFTSLYRPFWIRLSAVKLLALSEVQREMCFFHLRQGSLD